MRFASELIKAYFNYAYNPVYDFAVARLNRYGKLQEKCVCKLDLKDNDKVLCVGLGTGNELCHILEMNRNVDIVGVDYSHTALERACEKALALSKQIKTFIMDARCLEFTAGSFDRVVCIHVMDFIEDNEKATHEILRVLKDGGRFVITYPSQREGLGLGANLLSDSVRHSINLGKHRIRAILESLAQMAVCIVYLPLLFRPKRIPYSRSELKAMLARLTTGDFQIEEDSIYQDFIVFGRK